MKSHPVAAELFHADGHADRQDKANSRFKQFCEGAGKEWKCTRIFPHVFFETLRTSFKLTFI
jgi:hypothetical protein